MNILVTGGAGYIGSHACKALAARGYVPVAFDNLCRGNREAVRWGPLEEGDLADASRVRAVLEQYRPAGLLHFAAFAYVGESVADPLLYYRNNIAGSLSLLECLAAAAPIPVIFSSSCAVYGMPERLPLDEEHPQRPINPYGFTKSVVERMLRELDAASGIRSVALRYFNAAGADPDGETGESHEPETHLIPLVLAAAGGGAAIRIFGDNYDTPDGTCIRDYVHVSDIADAHVAALDYLLKGGPTTAFNLANNRGYSVREVVTEAERICGNAIPVEIAPRRAGDPPVLIGSCARARETLGWKPRRSSLEQQLTDAWNWMRRAARSRT